MRFRLLPPNQYQPWATLTLAMVAAAAITSLLQTASVRAAGPTEFLDLSFELPGGDWSPVSAPLPGAHLDRLVQYVRERSPHEELVMISSVPVQASASRAVVAASLFAVLSQAQPEGGRIDASAPAERSIAGRSHPVMAFRLVHDDGLFVRDGLYLIYFS